MKNLLVTLILVSLTACKTFEPATPEQASIVRTEYIVKIPPKELLTPPPPVPNINPDTATQADVAQWLIKKDERTKKLEDMLSGIAEFFNVELRAAHQKHIELPIAPPAEAKNTNSNKSLSERLTETNGIVKKLFEKNSKSGNK
jgi:hypothetical protein